MLPLHCFNVVVQFELEFFKFEFKLNLFESLAKERKKSLFRPKTPQPAQPFFFSPFLPAQPNPAGPIPSPRPSSRPLSSLLPTGRPHLSGPSPSSRARLGLEPESGHATPRRPSPWRTRQGLPRPLFKHRPTPLGPRRAAATATAPNPSSRAAIAELGAPRRAAIPPFPLDVFSAPKVRVVVRMLSVSLSLPISFSRLRSRSPALRRLWSTP